MLIAVDAGKYNTKAYTDDNRLLFRTKMENLNNPYLKAQDENTFVVEYLSTKYLIGEGATQSDYDASKEKLVHKLATYISLAKLSDDKEIILVIGCPIIHFINVEKREQYKQYIMDRKQIEIKLDNEYKKFYISDVIVLPESCGYIYSNLSFSTNRLIGIIDIGGLNTNAAIYDNLKPVKNSVFTINEGGNILFSKIKRELNSKLGLNYQDYEITHVINDTNNKIKFIVESVLFEHLSNVVEETKKYNWNYNAIPIVFTGGGSLLFGKVIKDILPNSDVSQNPIWDNVKGFYKVGEMLCRQK